MSVKDGFLDPGSPPPTNAAHKRRMEQGGLAGDPGIERAENMEGNTQGRPSEGFLKRNNFKDRF